MVNTAAAAAEQGVSGLVSTSQDGLNGYQRLITTSDFAVKFFLQFLYSHGTDLERIQKCNQEIQRLSAEGLPKTEIGRRYGISARRVGQILSKLEY
jgi:hypothetical protein